MSDKRKVQNEDCADDENGKGKKLKLDDGSTSEQKTPSFGRRKKKVDEIVCAICLYEGKRRITGKLDCCNHNFCFACIKKWGKVESRCPLCKQRFKQISKLPVSSKVGTESSTVVIQVPERDQDSGEFSPVDDLFCIECNESGNGSPLIFCNNCGAAAHDSCAHSGYAIPGGGWRCSTCRPIAVPLFVPDRLPVVHYTAWELTAWTRWFF